jgi:hypothetical protein
MGTWYLGPSGALVAIPAPAPGLVASPTFVGKVSVSLNGAQTLYRASQPRTWACKWQALTEDQSNYLRAVGHGLVRSPLRLIDGEIRNRLALRIASAGAYTQSGDDLTTSTGIIPDWVAITDPPATVPVRGVLSWQRSSTAADWITTFNSYDRVPLIPGEQIRVSCWARGTAVATTAAIDWWDITGTAAVARTTGTPATLNPTTWTYLEVLGTPTANEIEAAPVISVAAGVATSLIQTTGWMLAPATASTVWVVGGGAPTVLAGAPSVANTSGSTTYGISDTYIFPGLRAFELTLIERRM